MKTTLVSYTAMSLLTILALVMAVAINPPVEPTMKSRKVEWNLEGSGE